MSTRILVADDSTTIQKVIRIAFAKFPVTLQAASTLLEAKSILQLEPIDLVIMDSCLPGARGLDDLVKLMNSNDKLPFIFLEGSFQRSDISGLEQPGLREILKKPFESSEILDVVRRVLGHPLETPPQSDRIPPPPQPQAGPKTHPADTISQQRPAPESETRRKVPAPPQPQPSSALPDHLAPEELSDLVKSAVYDYCQKHIEGYAKEVITAEIRRLLDEKARQLIDN